MEQDKSERPERKPEPPISQSKTLRQKSSDRVIQSASGLAIAAAVVLVGGFFFAGYAALGGTVGNVLGATGGTSGTGVASSGLGDSGTGGASTNHGSGGANATNGGNSANANQGSAGQQAGTAPSNQSSGGQGAAGNGIGVGPGASTGGGAGATNSAGIIGSSKTVHLVALGDSLTHGLGDASGQGYVGDVASDLKQSGYSVIQSNLGIDGLTSQGLRTEVAKPEVTQLLQSANLVLISIGGNDLNDAAGLPAIHTAQIQKARTQFQSNLNAVLAQIRSVNKTATVLVIGLYNPYGDIASARQQTDSIVETWNADEQAVVSKYSGVLLVQTYDLFQLNPSRYLYIDHFHPNQAGYARIATRVWQDVQAATGG